MSGTLVDLIERAVDLDRHRNPKSDVAGLLERGMALVVDELEKRRFATTERPRTKQHVVTKTVPAAVKRQVYKRDGGACAWVGTDGRRCDGTAFLEFDHVRPQALGADHSVENGRLLCRAHNGRAAELALGKQHIEDKRYNAKTERDVKSALTNLGFSRAEAPRRG